MTCIISITLMLSGVVAADTNDNTPTLHFGNEKAHDITVSKDIYRREDSTAPMRESKDADDTAFYSRNALSDDEFQLILVGGETKESALTAVAGETYIRESANGQYYTGTDDDSHVYVFRPTATDGYICYIDGVRAVTDTDNSTFGSSDDFIAYAKKKIEEYKDNEILVEYASKELSDYLALDYVGKINYNHGLNLTTIPLTNKFTTTTTGEIMLRDGERAVFPKPRDKYRYI